MPKDQRSKHVLDLCDKALDLVTAERNQFLAQECGDDVGLRASVDSVLVAVHQASGFLDDGDSPGTDGTDFVGRQVGSYQIQERLGHGGMGSVYLAQRQEEGFEQQVAIKFVHGHLLAKELIERFNAERQILAALNHPYIAALIDGGTTDDGIPFIVMEYIEGVPIDEYCDEHQLNVRQRIKLIQKIAMAVQSAHQNLVIHRDLKPSNVIVTDDGIPKLLDFGIAKLIQPQRADEHGNTTLFGHQAMTPDYASPEHILENKVTTASDVYSLGVLSYQLLAGARPYHIQTTSHRELVASVEGLSVPRASTRLETLSSAEGVATIAAHRSTTPQKLCRTLAGDLDNILMKALHREPERRYVSIAAFSADFQRYLGGLPVDARPDTVGYRLSRFVARHRVGVGASVALAVTLVAGLAGTAWAYVRAEEARAEASERFDQVRELANKMMFDVFGEIENIPGAKSAQQILATTAQEYLEALSQTANAPPDVLLEAARGYSRLSGILDDQAVSDPAFRERSAAAADKALVLFESLVAGGDAGVEAYRGLAQLRSNRGNANLYNLNIPAESREEIMLALVAFEGAVAITPDDPELVAEFLTARLRMADTYKWQNNYVEGEQLMDALLVDTEAARARFPDDHDILKVAGDAQFLRGEIRSLDDRTDAAIEDFERALALYEPISRTSGERNPVRQAQVIAAWSLGNALVNSDQPAEAEAHYRQAMALTEVRFIRDPNDSNAQRTYQILRGSLASALVLTDDKEEAFELILSANKWFEEQAALDPETPGPQRSIAVGYHETAEVYKAAGQSVDACRWYARTLDKWQEIDQKFGISEFDAEQPDILKGLLEDC